MSLWHALFEIKTSSGVTNQDGEVGECVLISSCKSIRMATSCWKPAGGHWNPSKNEIPHPEMKVKKFLDESESGEWKVGLKLNLQKTKIMASGPITSWQLDGETMGTVRDFIFRGSKITADGDGSHEIKRHLLLGRKSMTNLLIC